MEIYLLRHAQTVANEQGINGSRTDSPLTDAAKIFIQKLIPALNKNHYDIVFVSPLKRTLETVQPYLDSLPERRKPEIIKSSLITERDLGELTNTPKGYIEKYRLEHQVVDKIAWRPPQGESVLDVLERAKLFLLQLKTHFAGKTVLICSHQNFLHGLELLILNRSSADFFNHDLPKFENGEIRKYIL